MDSKTLQLCNQLAIQNADPNWYVAVIAETILPGESTCAPVSWTSSSEKWYLKFDMSCSILTTPKSKQINILAIICLGSPRLLFRIIHVKDSRSYHGTKFGRLGLSGFVFLDRIGTLRTSSWNSGGFPNEGSDATKVPEFPQNPTTPGGTTATTPNPIREGCPAGTYYNGF